jgi:CBS domain-containing protein
MSNGTRPVWGDATMGAMDVELSEIRDFLAQHAPFDALPQDVLDGIPRQCTLRYARRGAVVLDVGQQGEGLHVVRSGAVDVLDEAGGLVERVGTGAAFGMSSLLEHRPTRYQCIAREDTLLIVLPPETFATLAREHTGFVTFYAGTHHDRLSRAIANLQQAASGTTVFSTQVGDLISREPVTTCLDATVADAAATMSRAAVSSILVTDEAGVRGIVTDRDLRNRVLAIGLDPGAPVREVMTSPALTVGADALAFEAMLEMVNRGIHHLPVVDDQGSALGVVTTTDLVRLQHSNPVYLAADIGRQTTLPGVVELARRIPPVLGELVDRDVSAADISRIMTALGDAVRRRVVALAEAELGPAPAPYSWVALGSVAREEEALSADQDHALVLAEPGHDEWFARLASRVADVLEEGGWPRCPGDVMATNPRWRVTVDEWREQFARWSREPEPEAVLDVAIFFDMRHLFGEPRLTEAVRRAASSYVSPRLLGHLSAQALRMRPPLGFFRGFVLENEGGHGETLDIKRGIAAVVQLARVYALGAGSTALSTRSRINAAEKAGVLDQRMAEDLRDALELMSYRRFHHQVEQFRAGARPDNHIVPADLTDRQRRHLKDAFGIVRSAQHHLANRLEPGYV